MLVRDLHGPGRVLHGAPTRRCPTRRSRRRRRRTTTSTNASFGFTSTPRRRHVRVRARRGGVRRVHEPEDLHRASRSGAHTFQVRATNGVGTDPTPASFSWTIVTQTTVVPAVGGGADRHAAERQRRREPRRRRQCRTTRSTRRRAARGRRPTTRSFTAPNELLTLSVSYRGRNTQSSCTQVVEIYRWTDSTWVQLDSRTVGTSEVAVLEPRPRRACSPTTSTGRPATARCASASRTTRSGTTSFSSQGDQMSITFGQ